MSHLNHENKGISFALKTKNKRTQKQNKAKALSGTLTKELTQLS